jgi:hypothetical protein
MADAFRDNLDACYKSLNSDDIRRMVRGTSAKIDVPEERKFTGFDGYLKAIAGGCGYPATPRFQANSF